MFKTRQTFVKSASFWIVYFIVFYWLSSRSKPAANIFTNSTGKFILISSELAVLPERMCFIWTSTRDRNLRKFNLPDKHRYGLEFQISRNCFHVVLLILLAGDIATNPGPTAGLPAKVNSKTGGLNVLYLNARSLKAFVYPVGQKSVKICKISLLQQLTYSGNYDVVCVCETWLNNSVLSSEILPNYGSIFRCDRVGRNGGGVLVAVKAGIQVTRRHDLEPKNIELVVVELMKYSSKPVLLYTFYRPPNSTPDVLQSLSDSLQRNPESSRIVVVGDFNLPSVVYVSSTKKLYVVKTIFFIKYFVHIS